MSTFTAGAVLTAAALNAVASDTGNNPLAGSYASGWSDYGSIWTPGTYRKIGQRVDIAGLVQCTSAISAGAVTTIATLPVGYRPATYQATWTGLTNGGTAGRIIVTPDGLLQWVSPTATTDNSNYTLTGFFYVD